ncbi:unnamed protein product [Rotaria sp. Silwood2]|nr:unnamed protein product [Rotaria sp. Silwood2]
MNNYGTCWPITTAVVPLTYLRIDLPCMDTLIRLISALPLYDTLRQLHVHVDGDELEAIFTDHAKFIRQLYHYILSLPLDKESYYSIETEGYGLTIWF